MKSSHYRTISFNTRKKDHSPKIRSPRFKRKYDEGMPRINKKAIQFHNIYDVQLPENVPQKPKGYQFWGCIPPQKKKIAYKNIKPSTSPDRQTLTRGQNMFRKYIKRRPNLRMTSNTFYRPNTNLSINSQNSSRIKRSSSLKQQQIKIPQKKTIQKDTIQEETSFLITQEQMAKINAKSIHKMTIQQLKVSIQWKKQFYSYYKQRLQHLYTDKKMQTVAYM